VDVSASGTVVVTGAGGFIGHALCGALRTRGRPLIGTVRGVRSGMPPDLQPVGDLADADDALLDDLCGGADAVVHLAGRAHVLEDAARDPEAAYRRANVQMTTRLARAAARTGVRRFILASSVKVNGESTRRAQPFVAGDAPQPEDAYARSKLAAERALLDAARDTPMVPIVLRLPLVYGKDAPGNFPRLVDAVRRGRRLPLASIANRRSLLYVGNLVDAIIATLDVPQANAGVYFVADAESVSTPDLVRAIAAAWRVRPKLYAMPVSLLRLAGVLAGRRTTIDRLTRSLGSTRGASAR
jgi:UDP-glucose 4-epimerase